MSIRRFAALFVLALVWPTATAVAQPLGTYRWQIQPYCNVLTVNVTQQAGLYTIDGTDDRCGAAEAASVVGIAFLNPGGSVGFGVTIVLPGGTPVHVEATINLASLNGTWRDSGGNNGSFIFTPGPGTGGAPRPVPSGGVAPASITAVQIAPAAVGAAQIAANSVGTANVVDGSIATADLAAPPVSAFVPSVGGNVALSTNTLVRSIEITASSAGQVIVSANGLFEGNSGTLDYAGCLITTGATFEAIHATYMAEHSVAALRYVPLALTRGFSVTAGAHTFNLICNEFGGTVGFQYAQMTAIFTPQ
jgi:hypothetical protein